MRAPGTDDATESTNLIVSILSPLDLDEGLVDPAEFDAEFKTDPDRFQVGRDGDHAMCPFQCDECVFVNVNLCPPSAADMDSVFMICVRRVILDSLWSREPETVRQNLTTLRGYLTTMALFEVDNPLPPRGPFAVDDSFGYKAAAVLVWKSMEAGRNSAHVQFSSIRKVRSALSNYTHTTPGGVGWSTIGSGESGGQVFTNSPTNSLWFRRFLLGCHKRMGDVWIPDRAITVDEIHVALGILEEGWGKSGLEFGERMEIALTGALLVIGFAAALRGEELPQIDLGPMNKHWEEGDRHPRLKHVPLVLVGRFKQTVGEKLFFQPLAQVTKSGISVKRWVARVLAMYKKAGTTSGPMFRTVTKKGGVKRASVGDMDLLLHDILRQVQIRRPDVLPSNVLVGDEYSVRRSLRRGSTSEAQNAQVPKEVIEANNRWRKHMRSRGVLPSMDMIERYSDAKASVTALIRYSAML